MGVQSDHFAKVVSLIQTQGNSSISVPRLSGLLGVKATTLNARFRRLQIPVQTVGRVNFIPRDLALELAGLHKYALLGWPTVQQASQLTAIKGCTIKAKCEKGQVEGYRDLTKRLRINPEALATLKISRSSDPGRAGGADNVPARTASIGHAIRSPETDPGSSNGRRGNALPHPVPSNGRGVRQPTGCNGQSSRPGPKPFVLAPPRDVQVKWITAQDYGLPELELKADQIRTRVSADNRRAAGHLFYDPDRPFSLSECSIGKPIQYGEYNGTIVGIVDEAFNPKIKVQFPDHQHPLMREVLLVVAKRRT